MKHFSQKMLSVILAGSLAASAVSWKVMSTSAAGDTKYELESGEITGSGEIRSDAGASGGSYVFLSNDSSDTISVTVPVDTDGMYTITLGYSNPYGGDKIQNLLINGVDQGEFSCIETADGEWADVNIGTVRMNAGNNTVTIKSSWGWTNFDYITIEPAEAVDVYATDITSCDPEASAKTQNLMSYLASVYGQNIISGQQEIYMYGPHDFEYEFEYLKDLTGDYPAVRGFDFLNQANILYGSDDGTTDRIIDWVNNKNGIATASWHVTVPKNFSSYVIGQTNVDWSNATYVPGETDFDTSKVLVEGSKEREYYMLCLESLASALQELQDADVPLIFRPLHEAEGGGGEKNSWFWWGKSGSAVYKELWKLTYETLTETYGLHNIIWEWNSYAYSTSQNWYPGDEYVDIIAYDKYNCTDYSTGNPVLIHNDGALGTTFSGIMEKYDNKKMVAMAENDSVPTLDNLKAENAAWLYFCTWYDGDRDDIKFLTNPIFNIADDLKELYQSDYCITLSELPEDLYTNGQEVTTRPTTTKDPNKTTTTVTTASDENRIAGTVTEKSGIYDVAFDREIGDTVILDFLANSNVSYANGGVGVSAVVDGENYWVNYQWEISKSGEITLKLDEPLNVTKDTELIDDADVIAKAVESTHQQSEIQVQIWWANDGSGEEVETSNVVLKNAYLPVSDIKDGTTTTPEDTDTPDETTTSDEVSETTATTSTTSSEMETTDGTNEQTTTTTATTVATSGENTSNSDVKPTLYGDINLDGNIDLTDAILLNKAIASAVQLNDQQAANANCDNIPGLDVNDSIVLLKFLVQLVPALPYTD